MKRNMRRFVALLLASVMLVISLGSCALGNDASDSDSGTGETVKMIPFITSGAPTEYILIYPDDASAGFEEIVKDLAERMNKAFPGIEIQAQKAFSQWGDSFATKYEILIGNTGRKESEESLKNLKDGQFIIKLYDSGKLVINGKGEAAITDAIAYFLTTYVMGKGPDALLIEENLEYLSEASIERRKGWYLTVPSYWDGVLSTSGYNTGYGDTLSLSQAGGSMQIISETNESEFNKYLSELKEFGYREVASHAIGANKYVQLTNGEKLIYTYYTDSQKEVRVINDRASVPETEFEYTYTPKATDTTTFYQYAMMYDPTGCGGYDPDNGKIYENNGLFDVIKLADNSVILLDGGWTPQATDTAVTELLKFLREITGTPAGQKVRIASIYFTHGHGDHLHFVKRLVEMYSNDIIVERMMHNLPDLPGWSTGDFAALGNALMNNNPKMKFIKLHTGQKIQLADVVFEVIYTHEDLVDKFGKTEMVDYNNVSTVLKMTIKNRTFMLTGDWGGGHVNRDKFEYKPMEEALLATYKLSDGSSYLKCDVVQIAHHAINDWMENFYKAVDADIAFFPQQDVAYNNLAHDCYKNIVKQLRATGMADADMHFSGRYTYGLTVNADNSMSLTYRKIAGADAGYDTAISKYQPFHQPANKTYK